MPLRGDALKQNAQRCDHGRLKVQKHQVASAGKIICTLSLYLTYLKKQSKKLNVEFCQNQEHLQQCWASAKVGGSSQEEVPTQPAHPSSDNYSYTHALTLKLFTHHLLLPSLDNECSWRGRKWHMHMLTHVFP